MNPDSLTGLQKAVEAAQGYFLLGMPAEAWNELDDLAPEFRHLLDVILLRVLILNGLKRWEDAAALGRGALRSYPNSTRLFLATVQAVRESQGVNEAIAMLKAREKTFAGEALFHFMLACLECQAGDIPEAKMRLQRATSLDKALPLRALDDPDLEPLWNLLAQ
jgi:tetratricopeptide (TPR) repeat protein